ncbi:MAG: ABC transporter ATP-binding protein [Sphaerochaeta sp.]
MIKYFQNKYSMSKQGSVDLFKAIGWTVLMDLSFMLPVIFSFKFLDEYMKGVFDITIGSTTSVVYYVILSVIFFVIMYVLAYIQYDSTYTKVYEESARKRVSLAETLRKLPLAYFGKKDLSDLSSTIMEDTTQIEMIFSHAVPQLYAAFVTTLLMGIMLFIYNWQLSLAVFWVVPVSLFIFVLSKKFQDKVHEESFNEKRDISDKFQEGLDSAHEIKSYNREEDYSDSLNSKLDQYEKSLIHGELLIGAFINLSYIFLKLGLPSVVLYGTYLLSQGSVTIFTYLVFVVVTTRIYNPIMAALDHFAALIFLNVRIKRMKEISDMPMQVGKDKFEPNGFDIKFNDVDFSYQEGVQTLKNVNFIAKQGEVTALVGPSGGGKSTVAKLAARFWDIDGGKITLGGEDISKINPEVLLNNFSIVFQDVTLFNSSILDNIRLGKKDATRKEIEEAAKLAQCDDFIKKLPQGYDTLIGENGEKLSGGERQRISIARAMLKDAPIILLDEATASLDAENESKIQSALSELIKEKTVLIIAHRMRTVSGADKIVVLKDGQILETGNPSELKKQGGLFASMLKKQKEK